MKVNPVQKQQLLILSELSQIYIGKKQFWGRLFVLYVSISFICNFNSNYIPDANIISFYSTVYLAYLYTKHISRLKIIIDKST